MLTTERMIVIGEKESFLIRVLVKKANDAGIDCAFVPWRINDINAVWDRTGLITVFMDNNEPPRDDVLRFLIDKSTDDDKQMILIGEARDLQYLNDRIPQTLVYKTFLRPVDNEAFIGSIKELVRKVEAGEYKKSILIVDDDPNYLSLVREWLREKYKVSMANSGLQAIKWLGRNKADLILLDYEMPVTSGPQVLEMLRNDTETSSIPVIFLTGKGDKESVMAVVSLKPEGYFLKTIQREELLEKLSEYFVLHK